MADEKKPKIDLKARLGKTAMGTPPPAGAVPPPQAIPAPAPAQVGMPQAAPQPTPPPGIVGVPAPAPAMAQTVPQSSRAPTPGPIGIPVGPPPFKGPSRPPPGLDANHPLAAAMAPQQPYRAPAPPAQVQPTRIEVDEVGVQQAAKSGRRQGLMGGLVAAIIFAVVGYLGGGAQEQSSNRKKSVQDAQELAGDVGKAKDKLKDMADKLDTGRNSLIRDHKFPDALAKDLGGINVDFGGDKLAFRRFSGFSQETMAALLDFITSVTALNDRKSAVIGLLTKLQKPITEQFKAAGQTNISQVILLGRQDESHNNYAILAPLKEPIAVTPPNVNLPNDFTFIDPFTKQPAKLAKYTNGDLTKPAALYVAPKSFDAVCPSDVASQSAQLGGQIKHIIDDIKGENAGAPVDPNAPIQDSKPGLSDRADRLIQLLQKVGQ